MIGRRGVLLALAAMSARQARAALPVPQGNRLAFRLIRHGGDIGRHTLVFERQGDTLTVRVTVDALVTLLSVPVVRYAHRAVEVWRAGTLVSLSGETDRNGRHQWVSASRGADGLVVNGSQTRQYAAPDPAGSTSY